MSERVFGTVKRWEDKGWGFIKCDDPDPDVFVSYRAIEREEGDKSFISLVVDQRVSFTIGQGDRGPIAENVRVLRSRKKT